jgi:hypothetical protein
MHDDKINPWFPCQDDAPALASGGLSVPTLFLHDVRIHDCLVRIMLNCSALWRLLCSIMAFELMIALPRWCPTSPVSGLFSVRTLCSNQRLSPHDGAPAALSSGDFSVPTWFPNPKLLRHDDAPNRFFLLYIFILWKKITVYMFKFLHINWSRSGLICTAPAYFFFWRGADNRWSL